jgi:hypothetical protein
VLELGCCWWCWNFAGVAQFDAMVGGSALAAIKLRDRVSVFEADLTQPVYNTLPCLGEMCAGLAAPSCSVLVQFQFTVRS